MKKTALAFMVLLVVLAIPIIGETTLDIKLNFYGPATDERGGPGVATSFYLKSLVQRNLQVEFASETLLSELRKTFNAPHVRLLASGELRWRSGGPASVTQIVQIDGRNYALILTPLPKPGAVNFKVGVVEESGMKSVKNILLDTEIVLPDGEVAMLGFRDPREKSYFFAFYIQGRNEDFGKDVMRLSGGKKPKKIKHVNPVYPEDALKKKMGGVVVLEAVIDRDGKVKDARTIASSGPILDDAAKAAVRQWVYEPYLVEGKAKEVLFTVTVTFALDPEGEGKKSGDNALTRLESGQRPHKIKDVKPVYPPEALGKKIEGVVILEAVADEEGKVIELKVISSPDQILTDAAIKAVKQWEYEPYYKDGRCKKVVFTATVTFSLDKD